MKILFVLFSKNIYDKHPVYALSAVLKVHNFTVKYIVHQNVSDSCSIFTKYRPDIVLYSCFSSEILMAVDFDKVMKEHFEFHSIIGGPGPTYERKDIVKSTIDAIGIGEVDHALVDYLNSGFLPNSNIIRRTGTSNKNYYPLADLDLLPFPDRSVIYDEDLFLKKMPSKQFMAGRGCPYHCTYCHNHVFMEEFKDADEIQI